MFNKEETYTIHEFLEIQRENTIISNRMNYVSQNKSFKHLISIGIGATLYIISNPAVAFANSGLDGLDILGNTFLTIIRRLGYWIALICAIAEIIKMASQGGGKEEILKVIMKYILIYAALFLIPRLFDLITTTLG